MGTEESWSRVILDLRAQMPQDSQVTVERLGYKLRSGFRFRPLRIPIGP